MAVKITGTILASLFYDNSSCDSDQCGFLLGEVVRDVKDIISDSQINNVEVETKIYIYNTVPCPRDSMFYNRKGEVQLEKINALLKDKTKNIVGWYCSRRNSTLRPTYRERLIHNSLISTLAVDVNTFTFLLCSEKAKTNQSTHVFDHCFLHKYDIGFRKFQVEIVNLGDTTHTEYRSSRSYSVSSKHGTFNSLVKQQEQNFLNAHGHLDVNHIQSLNGAISRKLENISQSLIESEFVVSNLEDEVLELRERVKRKHLEKQQFLQSTHTNTKEMKAKKQPSVDELLFMDQDEDMCIELPQAHLIKDHTQHEQSSIHLNADTFIDTKSGRNVSMADSKTAGQHLSAQVTNKSKMKLSTPVVLHTRSRSSPVEAPTIPSQAAVIRTRSRSGDTNSDSSTLESPKTVASIGTKKSSDPFAFVGEAMMASTAKTGPPDTSNSYPQDMESSSHKHSVNHKVSSKSAGAVASIAKKLHTREKSASDKCSLPDTTVALNPLYEHKLGKAKELGASSKKCSQEAGRHAEVNTDEDSSQDTYEMDVSSSPVY